MSVPSFKEFFKPILIFMSDGELHTNKELREKVIKYFKMNDSEINERTGGGTKTKVEDRVNWTVQHLRSSVIIKTVGKSNYKITPRGKKVFETDIDQFDRDYLMKFKEYQDYTKKKQTQNSQPKESTSSQEEPKPIESESEEGFVYYIQEEMDGDIKIGFSIDPMYRMSKHQTSNPRRLRMLIYVKGVKEDESRLHKKFESLNTDTGKEWFKPDKKLLIHIENEKSKFFEMVQKLSTDYENLKSRIEKLEKK